MTAEFLWINIPLMVLAFALWAGIPMWMVLRRPDRDPRETRTVPAYLRQRGVPPVAFPTQRQVPAGGRCRAARTGYKRPELAISRAYMPEAAVAREFLVPPPAFHDVNNSPYSQCLLCSRHDREDFSSV